VGRKCPTNKQGVFIGVLFNGYCRAGMKPQQILRFYALCLLISAASSLPPPHVGPEFIRSGFKGATLKFSRSGLALQFARTAKKPEKIWTCRTRNKLPEYTDFWTQ
jgi:hypothetical protein